MRIKRIIWLQEIEDKLIAKHEVFTEEVEEVLFGRPHVRFVEQGYRKGEDVYAAYGQPKQGAI